MNALYKNLSIVIINIIIIILCVLLLLVLLFIITILLSLLLSASWESKVTIQHASQFIPHVIVKWDLDRIESWRYHIGKYFRLFAKIMEIGLGWLWHFLFMETRRRIISYVQTVPNQRRLLIIDERSHDYSWTSVIRPSVIRISLLSGHDLAVYCLLSILSISNYRLYSLAQDKNKVVKYCICFILLSNPLNMSDNLLQIE